MHLIDEIMFYILALTFFSQAEAKKDELKSAQGVQTFHIECRETVSWIEDKKRILQQTDNLEMDLNGESKYYSL